MSPLHCETQATWENLFFTLSLIKLKMIGGYIYKIGAPTEAKPRLSAFVLYSLVSQINRV